MTNSKLFKGVWTKEGYKSFRRSMVERGHWHNHPDIRSSKNDCFKCELNKRVRIGNVILNEYK